jgi:hypothetical protein
MICVIDERAREKSRDAMSRLSEHDGYHTLAGFFNDSDPLAH